MVAVHVLAAGIARELGAGWWPFAADHLRGAGLRHGDKRLHVVLDDWQRRGRLVISGLWPRYADGQHWYPRKRVEITCAATRAPKEIAKEIRRRLLPAYEIEFARAIADVRQTDNRQEEAQLVAERLAAAIGGTLGRGGHLHTNDVHIRGAPERIYRLRVAPACSWDDVRVHFEVSGLDPDTAAEVLAVIARAQAKGARVATRVVEASDEVSEEPEDEATEKRRVIG